MITKYKTTQTRQRMTLEEVQVDRESDSSVWIGGRRSNKSSSCEIYHDTKAQAKAYLIDCSERNVAIMEKSVSWCKQLLEEAKAL